ADLGFTPHFVEMRPLNKKVGDEVHATKGSKRKVARFGADAQSGSDQVDSELDGMRPKRNHLGRKVDLRFVCGKSVLFNEVAGQLCKAITFDIAAEGLAKNNAEASVAE